MANINSETNGSVLLLAFHFPPENNIASARPSRFYKYLPRFGYDVQVVTASTQDENHPPKDVVCALDAVPSRAQRLAESVIRWLLKPLVTEESLRWALASYAAVERIISQEEISVIFSTSPPIVSNIVAGLLKQKHGIPWVADFRDPVLGNPDRKGSRISRLRDAAVEKWSFLRADALIANTDTALEMWKGMYPAYAKKMSLIWNGFDMEEGLGPLPLPQREHRLLVHAGGISRGRHPGILLSSLHRLIQRGRLSPKKLRVQLVGAMQNGWARDPGLVEELVRLGCLQYDGRLIPKDEAKRVMATSDFLLLLDLLPDTKAVQVPGKLFDYLRIGRPILGITTRSSPAEHLLSQSGVLHTSIYPDDCAEDVDKKVLHFLALPSEPAVANEWFWNEFEATAQTRHLASLIASLEPRGTRRIKCLSKGLARADTATVRE